MFQFINLNFVQNKKHKIYTLMRHTLLTVNIVQELTL